MIVMRESNMRMGRKEEKKEQDEEVSEEVSVL